MIAECTVCRVPFETKTRTTVCSVLCRSKRKRDKSAAWTKSNPEKTKVMRDNTRDTRRSSGKALEYQRKRRSTREGYADRIIERARKGTPDTDIDRDFILSNLKDTCQVTNVPFRYSRDLTSFQNPYAPSIDRIDSSRGYYKDNVQIVLVAINLAKSESSMEDFINVWKDITKSWAALTGDTQ